MLLTVLLLHLVLGIVLLGAGQRLGARAFLVAAVAPAATVVLLAARARSLVRGDAVTSTFDWVPQLGLSIDLRLDTIGLILALIVSGVGVLVCVYAVVYFSCLLYTSPSPRDGLLSRMPS